MGRQADSVFWRLRPRLRPQGGHQRARREAEEPDAGEGRDLAAQERFQGAIYGSVRRWRAPGRWHMEHRVRLYLLVQPPPVQLVRRRSRPTRRLGHQEHHRSAVQRPGRVRNPGAGRLHQRGQDADAVFQGRQAVHALVGLGRNGRLHLLGRVYDEPSVEQRHLQLDLRQARRRLVSVGRRRTPPDRRDRHHRPAAAPGHRGGRQMDVWVRAAVPDHRLPPRLQPLHLPERRRRSLRSDGHQPVQALRSRVRRAYRTARYPEYFRHRQLRRLRWFCRWADHQSRKPLWRRQRERRPAEQDCRPDADLQIRPALRLLSGWPYCSALPDSTSIADPGRVHSGRRRLLALAGALACGCAGTSPGPPPPPPAPVAPGEPLLDDVHRRTFDFFWQTANPANGLVPDRYPTPSPASIAAVGFALTAYPIGVERGWITRAQARERVLATLRFFSEAPQGPHFAGVAGYQGFFYHFLDMQTGLRARHCELSTVDTAWLLAGMLFCQSWFDQANDDEARIRQLVDAIYARVDWSWAQPRR